jgi:glycine/D-amino acid oxidase-like deaminating enzyme
LPAQWLDAGEGDVPPPSPARTCGGEVAWRTGPDGRLRVVRYGGTVTGQPADERLEDFTVRHFAPATPRPGARGTAVAGKSGDGFPFVGPVPGLNGAVACGFGTFGLGWAVLAARWAVEALLTGRDPTPPRFQASRGAAS